MRLRFVVVFKFCGDITYKFRKLVGKTDCLEQFKRLPLATKIQVTTWMFCSKLHACLLTHLWLIILPPSLQDGESVLRLNEGSLLNLFQMVGTGQSMSVVGLIVVLFVIFLMPLSPFLWFVTLFVILCVSMRCFTDN